MAHQDYVSRPRNTKKSPYQKASAKQQPQGVPVKVKLIGLITLIAVCCLLISYGVLKVTKNCSQQAQTTEAPKVADTVKDKATLPTPPKEKWAYRKELRR